MFSFIYQGSSEIVQRENYALNKILKTQAAKLAGDLSTVRYARREKAYSGKIVRSLLPRGLRVFHEKGGYAPFVSSFTSHSKFRSASAFFFNIYLTAVVRNACMFTYRSRESCLRVEIPFESRNDQRKRHP